MATLLNPPKQKGRIWFALIASVLLHGAAVALADINRNLIAEPVNDWNSGPIVEVEAELSPDLPPPPPVIPEVDPPAVPPEDVLFRDDAPTPPPARIFRKNAAPLLRPPSARTGPATLSSIKVFALNAPRPEYPYEARRGRITGDGVAVMMIDPMSGRVAEVTMSKSTGSAVLDQATIAGFRRWRFKTGTASIVRCPITYTLTGAGY